MIIFKTNKNRFSFQSQNIKVEFKDPIIQAVDEFGACKTEKDILYYYYNVSVYQKQKKQWTLLFQVNTYDFPEICTLKLFLEYFINETPNVLNYQKEDLGENKHLLSRTLDTGLICEDFYSVTHCIIRDKEVNTNEYFNIVIGKTIDLNLKDLISVSIQDLSKEDVTIILKCIDSFIKYSIKETNKNIKKRNSLWACKIIDKKLYWINQNSGDIDAVYVIGDKIEDMRILHGDMKTNAFYSSAFRKFIIKDIKEDSIIIDAGYEDKKESWLPIKDKEVAIKNILDIFADVGEEQLKYNEKDIANDFISILSNAEKVEFKEQENDFLFKKWKEVIINRTWMCRKEHNLPQRVKDKGNHENVYESVRYIIKRIKKILNSR